MTISYDEALQANPHNFFKVLNMLAGEVNVQNLRRQAGYRD